MLERQRPLDKLGVNGFPDGNELVRGVNDGCPVVRLVARGNTPEIRRILL